MAAQGGAMGRADSSGVQVCLWGDGNVLKLMGGTAL